MHTKNSTLFQKISRTIMVISTISAVSLITYSAEALILLTSQTRPSCEERQPCLVTEKKTKQNFRVFFNFEDNDGQGSSVKQVTIENLKTKTKNVFETPEAEAVLPKEYFKLFKGDFNKDGHDDLALYAYMSARQGPMYYRFTFDTKENQYKMTGPVSEDDLKSAD